MSPISLQRGQYFGFALNSSKHHHYEVHVNRYGPFQQVCKHLHENDYLSILLHGSYKEGTALDVSMGDLIYRPSSYEHSNTFGSRGGICLNIELTGVGKDYFDESLKLPEQVTLYKKDLGRYAPLIVEALDTTATFSLDAVTNLLSDMFGPVNKSTSLPWMSMVTTILENEWRVSHTLQSLSERVFVHPVYLCRAFRERTGVTVNDYQMNIRLHHAYTMLVGSKKPIHEIADACGFHDSPHFVVSFKKKFSVSPHRFRNAVRKLI